MENAPPPTHLSCHLNIGNQLKKVYFDYYSHKLALTIDGVFFLIMFFFCFISLFSFFSFWPSTFTLSYFKPFKKSYCRWLFFGKSTKNLPFLYIKECHLPQWQEFYVRRNQEKCFFFQVALLEHIQGACDQMYRTLSVLSVVHHLSSLLYAINIDAPDAMVQAKLHAIKNAISPTIFDDKGNSNCFYDMCWPLANFYERN